MYSVGTFATNDFFEAFQYMLRSGFKEIYRMDALGRFILIVRMATTIQIPCSTHGNS